MALKMLVEILCESVAVVCEYLVSAAVRVGKVGDLGSDRVHELTTYPLCYIRQNLATVTRNSDELGGNLPCRMISRKL